MASSSSSTAVVLMVSFHHCQWSLLKRVHLSDQIPRHLLSSSQLPLQRIQALVPSLVDRLSLYFLQIFFQLSFFLLTGRSFFLTFPEQLSQAIYFFSQRSVLFFEFSSPARLANSFSCASVASADTSCNIDSFSLASLASADTSCNAEAKLSIAFLLFSSSSLEFSNSLIIQPLETQPSLTFQDFLPLPQEYIALSPRDHLFIPEILMQISPTYLLLQPSFLVPQPFFSTPQADCVHKIRPFWQLQASVQSYFHQPQFQASNLVKTSPQLSLLLSTHQLLSPSPSQPEPAVPLLSVDLLELGSTWSAVLNPLQLCFGVLRATGSFELADRGDRSIEGREFGKGDGDSGSVLGTPLLSLLTLGVAGDVLFGVCAAGDVLFGVCVAGDPLLGVSDKVDLSNS
ncbi:WEB family protein [Senna tora]|uniref:WEB family protein n=1 Tax=Senna tora TaxID=362788 RepID=A0A835CCE3_9FABA|nr:WEB family protein [Senna tora]